jgi:hypothetical protein
MFTDSPVTPTRVECIIDLLRVHSRREWNRAELIGVLQPKGLPNLTPNSQQAADSLKACVELELIAETNGKTDLADYDRKHSTREIVLNAIDRRLLTATDVEPYYAPFYSYLLGLGKQATVRRQPQEWANAFASGAPQAQGERNPFNGSKYTGLMRWYAYSGHGWFDPDGQFQANPYERLLRQLPTIFGEDQQLTGEEFLQRVAVGCPELDCGHIYYRAWPTYQGQNRVCSLGLSHALVDLHLDDHIRLHCPIDSRGWSIEAAQPPNDGKTLRSGRIDHVEWLG